MSSLYVIVHEEATKEDRKVKREILRIKREEKFVLVNGKPTVSNYKIPEDITRVLVCGAYHGRQSWDHRCVDEQIKALRRRVYSPELYMPATISLDP